MSFDYSHRNTDSYQKRGQRGSSSTSPDNYIIDESDLENENDLYDFDVSLSTRLDEAIRILDQNGSGSVRNAPRILTLNNRRVKYSTAKE